MSDPSRPVHGLPPEQEEILGKCFHPSAHFTEFGKEEVEQPIPQRFDKIVRRYGNRIAVRIADQNLTYTELNGIANRLARSLVRGQRNRAAPVGLLLEKGAPLIASMLAVLKCGNFFVLLEPSFPKARLAAIVEDVQTECVIADRASMALAREAAGRHCRIVEFESVACSGRDANLEFPGSPEGLVYVSYTSGSTGRPKGVVQNHRNVLHDVMLRTNRWHICEQDRLSLLASDTSHAIKNAFFALLNGATLLPFDLRKGGLSGLTSWLNHERISICRISSQVFRNLGRTLSETEMFPHVRLLQLASDTILTSDVVLYKKRFSPNCILSAGISSTETGLFREYLIDHNTEILGSEVPVGHAVDGKEILLVDDAAKKVGFNRVGEIVVRSPYLSPGYWRNPDLTSARFQTTGEGGDGRLYFTGDLGLMHTDGCLLHKGRRDFRAKIRGYGVEIREVEKAILAHESIREAVVVARQNELGDTRLIAYFVPSVQRGTSASKLRAFFSQRLPDYMNPSAFVMLDKMPLTAGGKIDRQSLPEPGKCRPSLDTSYAPPRTPVEEQLVRIWADVLELDEVGVDDNFFELGGHSLTATRVVSRVIEAFQLDLPHEALFEAPTVAAMAATVEANQTKAMEPGRLGRILSQLESMSDEEAQTLLSIEKK